ncbi:MAG: 30S ribosomal protein S5 [Verrucomicrobiae bacterium]|nr:30S ribosomal protein S5 [Verrucomicrobiae bacterium]
MAPTAEAPAAQAPAPAQAQAPAPAHPQQQQQRQRGGHDRHRRGDRNRDFEKPKSDLTEKVVFINRCAKVVKGGRRFSFSALVVVGDQKGKVGYGFGKANEVSEAIRKGTELARRSLIKISIRGSTIPHEVEGCFGGGRVLLRPASPGTGIVAGGGVRAVVEAAGIRDIIGKTLGPSNVPNVVKATLEGLQQLRLHEEIMQRRGLIPKKTS